MKFNTAVMSSLTRANGIQAYTAIIKEINDSTIPVLENFERIMANDAGLKRTGRDINRSLGLNDRAMWPTEVLRVLRKHVAKENDFEELIIGVVPKSLEIEALDSRSAQVAQYIDNLFFFSEMSRKVTILEIENAAAAAKLPVESMMTPHDKKEAGKNITQWIQVFKQFSGTADVKISEKVLAMPEFAVGQIDEEMIRATYGKGGASPIANGFFSASWNPIFAIRSYFNQRLIKRYHVAKEQRQALEYRIQALEASRTGENDPRLEKIIEYHTGELKRLTLELSRIEEKAR